MALIRKNEKDEYIVVHHVLGESDVLDFLRTTSHMILDRLCFEAKTAGQSMFEFRNKMYTMVLDKEAIYRVEVQKDDTTEM